MSNKNKTETSLEVVSELLGYVAEDRAESAGGTTVFKDSMEGRMHLLLDVLLTDSWDLALVKVALATQEARPDIKFTHGHMVMFLREDWMDKRRSCRFLVRRLHRDEQGLDVLWLMLAAAPGRPWTYAGWIDRLTDAFNAMELKQVEGGMLGEATRRYEKWTELAGGFPALAQDPFKAVLPREWGKAEAAHRDLEKEARAAAAVAANNSAEKAKAWRQSQQMGDVEAAQDAAGEVSAGVTVITGEPKLALSYKALIGTPAALST
jgi:hypothetical protein